MVSEPALVIRMGMFVIALIMSVFVAHWVLLVGSWCLIRQLSAGPCAADGEPSDVNGCGQPKPFLLVPIRPAAAWNVALSVPGS
jgi:hypothetical protein